MADDQPCIEHAGKIGKLEGALPAIQRCLEDQERLILEIHKCVKGDNGPGLAEQVRDSDERIDGHFKNHRTFNRVLLAVLITVTSGILLKLLAG